MESFDFDNFKLKYYNNNNYKDKIKLIHQFEQIEKQLEKYFKKDNLCVIKLHKCDNFDDFLKYQFIYDNNKKVILINLLPLMNGKIAKEIIDYDESFHSNIYVSYNGKYVSSKHTEINESFLNLCNDILKTEEYKCNICMETVTDNNLIIQCLKCKCTFCNKCKNKIELKCPHK